MITQVNGPKRSELLARIPAATMRLSTVLKILAKVRNIRYLFIIIEIYIYIDAFH